MADIETSSYGRRVEDAKRRVDKGGTYGLCSLCCYVASSSDLADGVTLTSDAPKRDAGEPPIDRFICPRCVAVLRAHIEASQPAHGCSVCRAAVVVCPACCAAKSTCKGCPLLDVDDGVCPPPPPQPQDTDQ